jgi:hypothetical protein
MAALPALSKPKARRMDASHALNSLQNRRREAR